MAATGRLCVFCGASQGVGDASTELARLVGQGLAERGIGIVYGGGRAGLMGILADAALTAGGDVTGVIPQGLIDRELAHPGLTRLEIVTTLHERKARMAELSDGFIALPGGLGTLEELAEVASWAPLELHAKPIGLLDADRYWDPLLDWLDRAVERGFIAPRHRSLLRRDPDLGSLLARFATWTSPGGRWTSPTAPGGDDAASARVG
ncbi:MAG: TIGR00730 family Rossman fold protein [Candidatus Limnocylindrales bacterium]